MGIWYIVEYFASSEEMPEYGCMRAEFAEAADTSGISMNFNYSFVDDPEKEKLIGNITWEIPDGNQPAHWMHAEDTCEFFFNFKFQYFPLTVLSRRVEDNKLKGSFKLPFLRGLNGIKKDRISIKINKIETKWWDF